MKYYFVLLVFWVNAFALHIDVTQGRHEAIPLEMKAWTGPDALEIAKVVHDDLYHSGEFVFQSDPDYSITGAVVDKNGMISATVVVQSIVPSMKGEHFKVRASGRKWRVVAHHLSDGIYQHLTGVKGVFSTKLAYLRADRSGERPWYYLEVADMDGYDPHALVSSTQPLLSPAWSPDQHHLAYVSFEHHRVSIFVQDVRTGRRKIVAKFSGVNSAPSWSPNGRELAVVLTRSGHPHIYRLRLSDGHLTQLTFGRSIDTEPAWSHDGRHILFTSDRSGGPQIYQLTLSSGKAERVTFGRNYATRARWVGPADHSFVMLSRDQGRYAIIHRSVISGQEKVLVSSGTEESPSVSANGRLVAYAYREGGRSILGMVSMDGEVKLRLPSEKGEVYEPVWSGVIK